MAIIGKEVVVTYMEKEKPLVLKKVRGYLRKVDNERNYIELEDVFYLDPPKKLQKYLRLKKDRVIEVVEYKESEKPLRPKRYSLGNILDLFE